MELHYRSRVLVDDLKPGECTIHSAGEGTGKRWWNLWFYVPRETDGVLEAFVVPINPGGGFDPNGAGGKTWGFTRAGDSRWQVSPSIAVLDDAGARAVTTGAARPPDSKDLWHQTPAVVDVPYGEPWQP